MKLILERILKFMKTDNEFALLSSISCENPLSWKNKIFLTFDIDWAHDEIIEDVLQICMQHHVPATFFATHKTNILSYEALKKDNFEIGLHPNFNKLLYGDSNGKNFLDICSDLKEYFPDATSVRSHSLCFGSLIQTAYNKIGITHDSSIIVPYQTNDFPLFPWKMWDDLIRVPYFFCDYITAMTRGAPISELVSRSGLKVFDFHPIHIFLNTESLDRYELTRPFHHNPKELIKYRFNGYGSRSRLIELVQSLRDIL